MAEHLYSPDHVWIERVDSARVRLGISEYAREELGEIVYIELPPEGKKVGKGEAVCAFDSMKSASEIYSPVSGTVIEVNPKLSSGNDLAALNDDPEGTGWLFLMNLSKADELSELLTRADYTSQIS